MASYPPQASLRDQRRAARAATRLQQAQMRSQQAYYRRPSIAGPVLWIAVGVVALLLETGTVAPSTFWPWYGTWWPLVPIGLGLILLGEYAVDRNRTGVSRRPLGGVIGLMVVLALLGMSTNKVVSADSGWGQPFSEMLGGGSDWLGMMGNEHTRDVTLSSSIASNGRLTVQDSRGDVQVVAADPGGPAMVEVSAHKVIHVPHDNEQERAFADVQPRLTRTGAVATLEVPARDGASVGLRITVPAGVAVELRTSHGDVSVSGMKAAVSVTDSHGDLSADGLQGPLTAQMDHGDVTVHDATGDVTLNGAVDDVIISGVRGQVQLNGDFFGDTRVSSVDAPVHFHSSRTDLQIGKLPGEMSMDHGDLELTGASGGVKLRAEAKDVEIKNLAGDADIDDGNGDVDVEAGAPLGNLRLVSQTGSVKVTVPPGASFSVRASASDSDDLDSDFSGAIRMATGGGRKTLTGQIGQGGPHLDLTAQHGDLSLRKGAVASGETPERPEQPERPERPEHTRHLHTAPGEEPRPAVQ